MKKIIVILLTSLTLLTFMACEMDTGGGPITVISIRIDQDDNAFNIGDTKQLSVIFEPSNATDKALTWQTSNEEVATVDSNGIVTATGLGTATVTATASNTISATFTAEVLPPWSGSTDTSWYETAQSTFNISTTDELAGLAELVNSGNNFAGKTIVLDANIDLKGIEWTPIGSLLGTWFSGVFDGNEKTITGIRITDNTIPEVGLFGYVRGIDASVVNAGIRNLTVSGTIDISANNVMKENETTNNAITDAGLLAGTVWGFVENSHSTSIGAENFVSFISEYNGPLRYRANIGGLVGNVSTGDITDSSFTGTVYGETVKTINSGAFIGGLVGLSNGGSVQNSVITADVSGSVGQYLALGGAIGYIMANDTNYTHITYTGDLSGNVGAAGEDHTVRHAEVGGLIGSGEFGVATSITGNVINGTLSSNAVSADDLNVTSGGIIGDAYFKNNLTSFSLENNTINMAISIRQTSDAKLNVGGLVGKMYNASTSATPGLFIIFENCVITEPISVESTIPDSEKECNVGGLLGSGIKLVEGTFQDIGCSAVIPTVSVNSSDLNVGDDWGINEWADIK